LSACRRSKGSVFGIVSLAVAQDNVLGFIGSGVGRCTAVNRSIGEVTVQLRPKAKEASVCPPQYPVEARSILNLVAADCHASVIAKLFVGLIRLLRGQQVRTGDEILREEEKLYTSSRVGKPRRLVRNQVVKLQVAPAKAVRELAGNEIAAAGYRWLLSLLPYRENP